MKKMIVIIFLMSGVCVRAQGLSNLFSQQAADIKYVLAQIALLQVYIGYVEKGYDIARDGLTLIGDIKKGEFSLHSLYFSSLETVSSAIAGYSRIPAILSMNESIIRAFKRIPQNGVDGTYIHAVYSNLTEECSKNLDDLIAVTSTGTLQMTDDERINRIDSIYYDMKNKLAFAQYFTAEAVMLSAARKRETNDVKGLKSLE